MNKNDIRELYYITHIDNIPSILKNGIYSHFKIKEKKINTTTIYNTDIINLREDKKLPNNTLLLDYANLYFQPRNPMLYRVLRDQGGDDLKEGNKNIALIAIRKSILHIVKSNSYIATANAATPQAEFLSIDKGIKKLHPIIINDNAWWNDLSDGRAKIMAEFLLKDTVPSRYIDAIYLASEQIKEQIKLPANNKINLIVDRTKFFLPNEQKMIPNSKIILVEGDMFFSSAKVLTISVNTHGIMGKGLASRARYQFPDVYVEYQDLCRSKKLKMGKPYLIKREKSLDETFSYEPETLKTPRNKNTKKWFLLFPTKNHWREKSTKEGIAKGLEWLIKNCEKDKEITSIALPALGCGLGGLLWKEIYPLMFDKLKNLAIPVFIYLPMGEKIKNISDNIL